MVECSLKLLCTNGTLSFFFCEWVCFLELAQFSLQDKVRSLCNLMGSMNVMFTNPTYANKSSHQ